MARNATDAKKKDAIVYLILAAIFIFQLWRCRYGFASNDESHVIALAYRFFQGDAMFVDEWSITQMYSVVLIPFIAIYLYIVKSTVGIILFFRYLFCVLQFLLSIYTYKRLLVFNRLGAALAAVLLAIFIPSNISSLHYSVVGFYGMLYTMITLITVNKGKPYELIFAGLAFSVSVLCNPWLSILWIVSGLYLFIHFIRYRKEAEDFIFTVRSYAIFSIGIILAASLFLIFVFGRASVTEVTESIPIILDDPSHRGSFLDKLRLLVVGVFFSNTWKESYSDTLMSLMIRSVSGLFYVFYALDAAAYIIDKGRKEHRLVYFYYTGLLCIVTCLMMFIQNRSGNYRIWFLNLWGLYCGVDSEDQKVKRLFQYFWIPGMISALMNHFASNTVFVSISSTSTTAAISSIIMIILYVFENKDGSKRMPIYTCTMIGAFFSMVLITRIVDIGLSETTLFDQKEYIPYGCLNGVYMDQENAETYERNYEDISALRNDETVSSICDIGVEAYVYLDAEKRVHSSSVWTYAEDRTEKLKRYFTMYPDKLPDAGFCVGENKENAMWLVLDYGYSINETDHNNYILYRGDSK